MQDDIFVYVGHNAGAQLVDYCQAHHLDRLLLVFDENTYAAAGQRLVEQLTAAGFDLKTAMLTGPEITADERNFVQVLLAAGREARTYVAVGSGSITDITRFVSFHTGANFISFPTAASVDGFTSAGAPSVIDGFKKTIYCHSPLAVFGDLTVLSAAPQAMTASGFGDMLGKYIALADWQLGHLLWDEPFDAPTFARMQATLQNCVDHAPAIGQATPEGLRALFDGLIESGLCMLAINNSRPASGAEHQISHYLEMKLIREQRPAVLHGAKVGAASVIAAGWYQQLRRLSRAELLDRLEAAVLPPASAHIQTIEAVFPAMADKVLAEQHQFLSLSAADFEQLKLKIATHWDEIQHIAASVPAPEQLAALLQQVGGQTDLMAFGFAQSEVDEAVKYAHYLRNRFNIDKLGQVIGLEMG